MTFKSVCLVLCLVLFAIEAHGYMHYVAYKRNTIFFHAWQLCRLHGGHLATIETAEENARVETAIKAVGSLSKAWIIGGADLGLEGNFVWLTLNKKLTYRNFNDGEPNNGGTGAAEHCLAMGLTSLAKWNDIDCNFVAEGFVCAFIRH